MSWKLAVPLGFLMAGAVIAGLVALEQSAPFTSKPSILLRASAGDRAPLELPGQIEAAAREAEQARAARDAATVQAAGMGASLVVGYEATKALAARIEEKHDTEWKAVVVPSPAGSQ